MTAGFVGIFINLLKVIEFLVRTRYLEVLFAKIKIHQTGSICD